ncbi:hypothetical protein HY469_04525, partial [Candidatus Roizmanbacteria bacterium]|nr:hypothetical protein [Candidatus Roizmanbacteria bacterium]
AWAIPLYKKHVENNYKFLEIAYRVILGIALLLTVLPGLQFSSIYFRKDTRVQASEWIYENIPAQSYILSETANVVDIPVGLASVENKDYTVVSFNFYELDHPVEGQKLYRDLLYHLENANYIFVPSRRIFANYLRFPERYPRVNAYYQALFSESGELGFELIHTTSPCIHSVIRLCDEYAEETWTVFDHPVIRIYNKVTPKTREEYDKILSQSE